MNTINNKQIIIDNQSNFSFIVAGHIYGAPSLSIFPSPSITSNIDKINSLNASFLLLLGDNYRQLGELHVSPFKTTFLNKLKMPVFNAVGNHDLTPNYKTDYYKQDYLAYKEHFGQKKHQKTYYSFVINSSLFIILDSELSLIDGKSNGSIKGEQLDFLKKVLDKHLTLNTSIKNIFIGAHKELNKWKGNNFHAEIAQLFYKANSSGVEIFMLSGDMSKAKADLYIKKDLKPNITYIHTHLTDGMNDKILQFTVSTDGLVKITVISLTGLTVNHINDYSIK